MFQGVAVDPERYMTLLSERQKLVASNIANADTPGYHTQDIDFRSEFENATAGLLGQSTPGVVEPEGLVTKADGNNVNLDREARLLSENALRFSIASNFARSELQTLKTAIQEGKGS
jgi:flagellar basal-body rod protein FlgB